MNFVVTGPPGSGKTTYVGERLERNDVVMDLDTLFQSLSGLPLYDKPQSLVSFVLDVRDYIVDRIAEGIPKDAYVITSSGKREILNELTELLEAELVILDVQPDICIERIKNDPRRDKETNWEAIIRKWWSDYLDSGLEKNTMSKNKKEIRYFPAEMHVDQEGRIEGYAAVFNQWSEVLGFFKERISSGAFKKTLEEADVRALFNHDPNYVLGRNTAGTLDLVEDDHGLQFRVSPPAASWANDLQVSVNRGDIDQASFGFEAVRDEWDHNKEPMERELIEVRLFDVSVVTYPAYPQTSVSARSLAEMFIARVQKADDPEIIRYMLEQLDEIIAASAPEQEPHPEDDLADRKKALANVALRKRKLELVKVNLIEK